MIAVAGHGSSFPGRILDNSSLATELDRSEDWIVQRCGVLSRNIADDHETTATLGVAAAREALNMAACTPDVLICCTCTPDRMLCPTAPAIAKDLGLDGRVLCFDINGACSGGAIGLLTAAAYLTSNMAESVLLVFSDTMTKHLKTQDAGTRILFGDGAVALVLTRGDIDILYWAAGSDGGRRDYFSAASPVVAQYLPSPNGRAGAVEMNGRGLFRFAMEDGLAFIRDLCRGAGVAECDIAMYFVHQANIRIIEGLQQRLGVLPRQWATNIGQHGNLTSASVPLLLIAALNAGRLKRGDKALVAAFGAGLTWAGMVLQW